jgi:hypothetical protein
MYTHNAEMYIDTRRRRFLLSDSLFFVTFRALCSISLSHDRNFFSVYNVDGTALSEKIHSHPKKKLYIKAVASVTRHTHYVECRALCKQNIKKNYF